MPSQQKETLLTSVTLRFQGSKTAKTSACAQYNCPERFWQLWSLDWKQRGVDLFSLL